MQEKMAVAINWRDEQPDLGITPSQFGISVEDVLDLKELDSSTGDLNSGSSTESVMDAETFRKKKVQTRKRDLAEPRRPVLSELAKLIPPFNAQLRKILAY